MVHDTSPGSNPNIIFVELTHAKVYFKKGKGSFVKPIPNFCLFKIYNSNMTGNKKNTILKFNFFKTSAKTNWHCLVKTSKCTLLNFSSYTYTMITV